MPNWVYNNLTISDPTGENRERIERLVAQVGATYTHMMFVWCEETKTMKPMGVENSDAFSFWNIDHPEGKDLVRYEASIGQPGSPYWYDWNTRYWGVKWDASDSTVEDISPTEKMYRFETAWSPPIPILATLSSQYPELHIELDWEEEQGFGGACMFMNGEVEVTDSYDIPDSHADHAARDKTCPCEDWGPEEAFPDCPSYVAHLEGKESFKEDELEIEVLT